VPLGALGFIVPPAESRVHVSDLNLWGRRLDCNFGLVGPTFVTGIILGSIYALIALGYTMVYGVLKLINFAHDAVFAVGAVGVFYIFGEWFGITEPMSGPGLLFVLLASLLVGGIVSALGAALLERAAYRPLRKRGAARLSFLISAIGASFFVTYMMQQGFLLGPGKRGFPGFMATQPAFRLFDSTVTNTKFLTVIAALLCFVVLDRFVNQTKTGRSIRALSEDIVASQLMGVNIDRVILTTFLIGGFFGGVAGTLYSLQFGFVVWNMGFIQGLKAFTAAVLGGIGNIRGAMIGGIMLGLIENMSTICIGAEWKNVIAFSVLVLVLILRPTGLLGERIGG
jgi:branched-chain amino acid transport system permease protein